eukprot:TRINITY_DN61900_c0_g1_i1.p1 TRINITY_DN61900_c0_g1~~TRINITY_DN61900_c0_g1_i1.p1  ORF type:complete len:224 (-),score=27.16 TRINITY_DN61900_c0_g1_i1:57-728(-)
MQFRCLLALFASATCAHARGSWFLAKRHPTTGTSSWLSRIGWRWEETISASEQLQQFSVKNTALGSFSSNTTRELAQTESGNVILDPLTVNTSQTDDVERNTNTSPASMNSSVAHSAETRKSRRRPSSREASLIDSLKHMGAEGENAVACVSGCRYGEEERHSWRECLERCVDNHLMRTTFLAMLPPENHVAHPLTAEIPHGVVVPDKVQYKRLLKQMRSGEL